MNIARARAKDAEALTRIAIAAKRHWGYPSTWMQQWKNALTVTSEYIAEHPTFIANTESEIVGFCALQINGVEAFLDHLWVLPASMKKGVGRALFEHAENHARKVGATHLTIEGDPHAVEFYMRMGARIYGRRQADMDGQERFLPLLEKAL
ncbi:GNAT family N-acetyltransferase [Verrucomicrobium sp. BvORR106]|uniref:GNAT family N-acetyltransferase n=1 Tax=Verrucomicrobium sp. BvORR106 TaxID=1403819 RepID=UPI00056F5A02|nr:GNAT family N-acetyltransferase [Verrucomicrobium sp. BvORR106]